MTMQTNVPLEVPRFSLEHQSFGNVGVSCSFFQPLKNCQTVQRSVVSANMNDERSFKQFPESAALEMQILIQSDKTSSTTVVTTSFPDAASTLYEDVSGSLTYR